MTATSLSSTTSTGSGRNGGATRKPASSVRVPGSNAVSTPVRAAGSGWDGTNTFWSSLTASSLRRGTSSAALLREGDRTTDSGENSTLVEIAWADRYIRVMTAQEAPVPGTRRGRRPGAGSTRQACSTRRGPGSPGDGFAATTIRGIAADAGVDASQVMQFFRSKDELFAAVMAVPASALERFDTAFEGPDEHLGERVVRAYLERLGGRAPRSPSP